jgi:hypothetical protein
MEGFLDLSATIVPVLHAGGGLLNALPGIESPLEGTPEILARHAHGIARPARLDVHDLHLGPAITVTPRVCLRLVEWS